MFSTLIPTLSSLKTKLACFIIVLMLMFQASCKDDTPQKNIEETPAFKTFIEQSDMVVLAGDWSRALHEIDSFFRSSRYFTARDSFNYYHFCYDVNARQYKNYNAALLYTDSMERVLQPYKKDALISQYALVHYWRGDIYFYKGSYQEAYQEYFKGRELGFESLDPCMLSDYSYRLGMILYQQERYREAQIYFKEANVRMENCIDDFPHNYRTQEVFDNIGLCFYHLKEYDSAIYYFNQSIEFQDKKLTRETPRKDYLYQSARGVVLGNLASAYEARKDFGKAEELYKQSIHTNIILRREPRDGLLTNLKLARMYYDMGDLPKMKSTLDYEKSLLDTLKDVRAIRDWNLLMSQYHAANSPATAYQYLAAYNHIRDSLFSIDKSFRESDVNEHLNNIERQQRINRLEEKSKTRKFYLFVSIVVSGICLLAVFFIFYYLRRMRRYVRLLNRLNERVGDQRNQLKEAMEKLEHSNQDKDKILRVVAHDLRSPIAAIYALADLSLADPDVTSDQKENLELIKTASNNALTLSKELLDNAILMQQTQVHFEPVLIAPFMSTTIELLRFRASEKNQSLTLSLPGEPVTVAIDKEKFARVITNLIINAVKFSVEGASIHVKVEKAGGQVIISVKDNGIGIPEKDQDKVFNMFTEIKRDGTGGEKSFGLGLSISKQIVEAHHGRIWLESKEQQGTTFFIALPLY